MLSAMISRVWSENRIPDHTLVSISRVFFSYRVKGYGSLDWRGGGGSFTLAPHRDRIRYPNGVVLPPDHAIICDGFLGRLP